MRRSRHRSGGNGRRVDGDAEDESGHVIRGIMRLVGRVRCRRCEDVSGIHMKQVVAMEQPISYPFRSPRKQDAAPGTNVFCDDPALLIRREKFPMRLLTNASHPEIVSMEM